MNNYGFWLQDVKTKKLYGFSNQKAAEEFTEDYEFPERLKPFNPEL